LKKKKKKKKAFCVAVPWLLRRMAGTGFDTTTSVLRDKDLLAVKRVVTVGAGTRIGMGAIS
jgi:hypothetical protein